MLTAASRYRYRHIVDSAYPKNDGHRILTLFSGLSKALRPRRPLQPQKRLLGSSLRFLHV